MVGPPLVGAMSCVAWYPTMYDAKGLFGVDRRVMKQMENGDVVGEEDGEGKGKGRSKGKGDGKRRAVFNTLVH